jgi:hypothetical protein
VILTDANGTVYRAHFRHTREPQVVPTRMSGLRYHRGEFHRWYVVTECTLHVGQCKDKDRPCKTPDSSHGEAKCSRLDQFDRRKGLKIAFERALIHMYPWEENRAIRSQLWASFWTRVRRPRHG